MAMNLQEAAQYFKDYWTSRAAQTVEESPQEIRLRQEFANALHSLVSSLQHTRSEPVKDLTNAALDAITTEKLGVENIHYLAFAISEAAKRDSTAATLISSQKNLPGGEFLGMLEDELVRLNQQVDDGKKRRLSDRFMQDAGRGGVFSKNGPLVTTAKQMRKAVASFTKNTLTSASAQAKRAHRHFRLLKKIFRRRAIAFRRRLPGLVSAFKRWAHRLKGSALGFLGLLRGKLGAVIRAFQAVSSFASTDTGKAAIFYTVAALARVRKYLRELDLKEVTVSMVKSITTALTELFNPLLDTLQNIQRAGVDALRNLYGEAQTLVSDAWADIQEWNTKIQPQITALYDTVMDFLSGLWSNFVANIPKPVKDLYRRAKNAAKGFASSVATAYEGASSSLSDLSSGAVALAQSIPRIGESADDYRARQQSYQYGPPAPTSTAAPASKAAVPIAVSTPAPAPTATSSASEGIKTARHVARSTSRSGASPTATDSSVTQTSSSSISMTTSPTMQLRTTRSGDTVIEQSIDSNPPARSMSKVINKTVTVEPEAETTVKQTSGSPLSMDSIGMIQGPIDLVTLNMGVA